MSNVRELTRANEVFDRLQARAPGSDEATVLVASAALHLGHARIARGLAAWEQEPKGLEEMQARLSDEQFDVVALAPASFAVRSAVTAVDLCAAAAYRLSGALVRNGREADVARLAGAVARSKVTLRAMQASWLDSLKSSSDWAYLLDARHVLTHRLLKGHSAIGGSRSVTHLLIDGRKVAPLELADRVVRFGEREFGSYCDAVLADYP